MQRRWLALIALSVFATAAQAQVYKCRQADGSLRYSDKACPNVIDKLSGSRLKPNTVQAIEPANVAPSRGLRNQPRRRRPVGRRYPAGAALADKRRRETRYADVPSVSERMAQRRADREASRRPPSSPREPAYIPDRIDPFTGKRYQSIGGGQYIDPMNGSTTYTGTPGGLVNNKNAQFMPAN